MTICEWCHQELPSGGSCTRASLTLRTNERWRVRFGKGRERSGGAERCAACGTPRGGIHRYGCAAEECPRCHDRLAGCDCAGEAPPPGPPRRRLAESLYARIAASLPQPTGRSWRALPRGLGRLLFVIVVALLAGAVLLMLNNPQAIEPVRKGPVSPAAPQ